MYLRTGLRRAPSRFESEDFKNKLMRTDIIEDIRAQLFALQDKNYREFHARLMPNIEKDRIIGIRVPVLRKYAKELARGSRLFLSVQKEKRGCNTVKENDCDNVENFLNSLPHYYYEENNLHMFLIMQMKDYDTALAYLEAFLPYIDNWATCDSGVPAVFKKHKKDLLLHVYEWLDSDKPYTVRYGIGTLMRLYLDEDFDIKYAYELCRILIGFLVFGLIFGVLSNVPVYVMLIVPLFVVCAKLTVSAFILWSYENHNHGKIKINVSENRLGSFKVILAILFLAAAYGLPALGFCPPVSALFVLMLFVIVIGVFSCRRIVTFDKYRIVYGQILKDMDSMVESAQNMDVDKNRKLISAEKESLEQNSRIEKKKGFEYLNAVFINRHKRLLWKPVKRVCAICILLVAAGIGAMLYLDDPGFRKDTAELLLKNLGMSTFWMYLINRGMGYTQALFMNCDHSLLCYPFYRKPKAVLELFTIRLREIIKINLPPALILGAGLSAMLFISHGTQNPLNYLILFLVFPAESVFFSVHYLVIYYLLQPYNAGTEIKSGMYKVITGLTYVACYMTIQLRMSTLKFGSIMITFSVVYCVVACVLAYRIAPRTFKIRE